MKKLLTSLLCVMMVVCFMPSMAWADGETTENAVAKIGENPYETLPAAISAAEEGQTVELTGDVVIPAGENIVVDKNIVIEGNDHTVTVNSDNNDYGIEGIYITSASGATIQNIVFEGLENTGRDEGAIYITGKGTSESPIRISRCTFNGGDTLEAAGGMGILTTYGDTEYVEVANCFFSNLKYGIYYNAIKNSSIKGCTFDGTKYNAINIAADNSDEYPCTNIVIEGNTMENISQAGYSVDTYASAINAGTHASEIAVSDNTISMLNGKPVISSGAENAVTVSGGTYDVASADQITQLLSYISEDGDAKLNLTESLNLTEGQTLDLNKSVYITAEDGKNISLQSGAEMKINADVTFTDFNTTTAIIGYPNDDNTSFGTITVAEGKALTIKDNKGGNGMNGGQLNVNGGTVVTSGNVSNGICAKVVAKGGSITATGNGKRGLTLNGGSELSENTVVTATGNNTSGFTNVSDLEINTNPAIDALKEVVIGAATVTADTMQGHAIYETVAARVKTVIVNSEEAKITVNHPVEDDSVGDQNKTSALFKDSTDNTTIQNGVVVLGDEVGVYGSVTEVGGVEYGQTVVNHTDNPITVEDERGNKTTIKANESATITKPVTPPYIPTTPTTQKPVIETNADVTTSLSADGTTLTIKANDGYEITDVTVNGVSKGAVDKLTGLKTGDKVVIKTQKVEKPDDNAALIEAVKSFKLVARSANAKAPSGKKAIKVTWFAKDGSELNFDGYEIYRSTKKNSGYGTKPIYKTTKSLQYFNTSAKKGTRYYYKVRGYKMIGGEKVYTPYSLKAIRTAK